MANLKDLNPPRTDGYPKITDISALAKPIPTVVKSEAFLKPIKNEDYSQRNGGMVYFKVKPKN